MVRRAEHPDNKPGRPPDGGVQIGRDNNGPLITGSVTGNVTDSHDVHYHLPPVPAPDDGPIVLGDIPAQPIAFQPRDDLVELVADARVAVLCPRDVGPGVGKTHVAAAYARRCAAAGWCLVGWLDASSLDAAALGLAGLAQHFLGVPPHEDVQTTATRFRDWLATHGDQTLLVLDNADSADTVRPFIPTTGTCHVVITTRDQKLAAQIGAVAVEVG
ncbi:MAG: hypothetical protein FWF75_09630, partial [Propionibacteriaceae bacterium]|nr:hypothetical protein [Propionibacteriaceae bacterium]